MTIDLTAKVKAIKRLRRRVSLPAMAELGVWQIITPKTTLNLGEKNWQKQPFQCPGNHQRHTTMWKVFILVKLLDFRQEQRNSAVFWPWTVTITHHYHHHNRYHQHHHNQDNHHHHHHHHHLPHHQRVTAPMPARLAEILPGWTVFRSDSFKHTLRQHPNLGVLSVNMTILEGSEGQWFYLFEVVILAGDGIFLAGDAQTQPASTG